MQEKFQIFLFQLTYLHHFLITLSGYLGFYPNMENASFPYFDLINGCFTRNKNEHKHYISNTKDFVSALNLKQIHNKKIILDYILDYYRLHVDGLGYIKSKKVLVDVFNV